MKTFLRPTLARALSALLARTPLQFFPTRIQHGFLRGCRWTLWPHSAYWRGHYEPEVQAALARHAPAAGSAAWDLGAHFGFYTLWLARAVGPTGQVCAFEPDDVSFDRLRRHVALNRFDHVRIYPRAVSDVAGEQLLIQNQGAGATTSHLAYQGEVAAGQKTLTIKTAAIDALIAAESLTPPQFLKIDVEGHAGAALRGARTLLANHRPVLLISLHSPEELSGVREQVEPLGYRPFGLDGTEIAWPDTIYQTVVLRA